MKELGVFGLLVPTEYGGSAVSVRCFAMVTEELSRGWMSLAGAVGSHSVVVSLLNRYGTVEQKERFLPEMSGGRIRAAMALTEPGGGSDLQAIRTKAEARGDAYVVNGEKTWITNAERASLVALLVKTDPAADPRYKGISILLAEKGAGMAVSAPLRKLGYKGVESCTISFDDYRTPVSSLLGGAAGEGFVQMMRGLEVGRIQIAARAVGVAKAAFDEALSYAQTRSSFGKPIWKHQSIAHYLANMATAVEAARSLLMVAADTYDSGKRCDLEAGMAKLFASEMCKDVVFDAMRIFGAYGYSPEYNAERYYRDAPLMVIGEGTNEIQRNIIAQELIKRSSSLQPKQDTGSERSHPSDGSYPPA
jgi:alkylation response protein AidB-like acyl-CoA dehydrogenase